MKSERSAARKKKKKLMIDGPPRRRKGDIVLHIGKSGGTYLKHVLFKQLGAERKKVQMVGHRFKLATALKQFPHAKVVFTVREPVSLFVSAFNSRLRKGQPRYYSEWTDVEAIAFGVFKTPNELGEALSSPDPALRASAEFAMLSIKHVRSGLKDYLVGVEFLKAHKHRLGFILDQSQLDEDIRSYAERLKLDVSSLEPSVDDVARHATPQGYSVELSETAVANLRQQYADDIAIYEWCRRNKADINSAVEEQDL